MITFTRRSCGFLRTAQHGPVTYVLHVKPDRDELMVTLTAHVSSVLPNGCYRVTRVLRVGEPWTQESDAADELEALERISEHHDTIIGGATQIAGAA